jgi:hypothetical protein
MEDMIFTVTQSNKDNKYGALDMTITLPYDTPLPTVFEAFERMALALTYTPNSLITAYEQRLAELKQSEDYLRSKVRREIINELNASGKEDYYA